MNNLLTDAKVLQLFPYQAASTTSIDGATEVDMLGYESCLFMVFLGDMTANSVLNLTVYHGDTSGSLSASEATSGNVTSDGTDDTIMLLDVHKPKYRYLEPQLSIATQNAEVHCIVAIQYNGRNRPITQDSSVISDELFVTPDTA